MERRRRAEQQSTKMILRKIFNPVRVIHYLRFELAVSVGLSVLVYFLYQLEGVKQFSLPFSTAAILGSALAIFLAFRNNSSYGRWWEARTLWGGIVNSSRVLARLVVTFADSHRRQAQYEAVRSEAFKKRLTYLQIAWVWALNYHLRRTQKWDLLRPFFTKEADFEAVGAAQNKPNYIQLLMGRHLYAAMADGTLGGFDSFQIEGQLLALANYQGGCERIKNTPLLRQYHYFTKLFLFTFMLVLPFSLIGDFARMDMPALMIPISVLISFVFGVMGKVGEVNEDPFENLITDVPLDALCNTIERDLRETLGEQSLPEKLAPVKGFLW